MLGSPAVPIVRVASVKRQKRFGHVSDMFNMFPATFVAADVVCHTIWQVAIGTCVDFSGVRHSHVLALNSPAFGGCFFFSSS